LLGARLSGDVVPKFIQLSHKLAADLCELGQASCQTVCPPPITKETADLVTREAERTCELPVDQWSGEPVPGTMAPGPLWRIEDYSRRRDTEIGGRGEKGQGAGLRRPGNETEGGPKIQSVRFLSEHRQVEKIAKQQPASSMVSVMLLAVQHEIGRARLRRRNANGNLARQNRPGIRL